jgi:DNA-binding MarR family transcriptional regulator
LCAGGLVRREHSDRDGRGSEVHLTPAGLDALREASGPHLRSIKTLFVDALDPAQQAAVADAMRTLAAHLDGLEGGAGAD